jgi:hypothetical protein
MQPLKCTPHADNMLDMDIEHWLQERDLELHETTDMPAYIALVDDPQWALYFVGQPGHSLGYIVTLCLACTKNGFDIQCSSGQHE